MMYVHSNYFKQMIKHFACICSEPVERLSISWVMIGQSVRLTVRWAWYVGYVYFIDV